MMMFLSLLWFVLMCIQVSKGLTNKTVIASELLKKTQPYCSNDSSCPTWFICDSENKCQCGDGHNDAVVCDNENHISAVLECHCVTYDSDTGNTFLGSCFYNCEHDSNLIGKESVHVNLPKSPEMLINKSVCIDFNRKGVLCGDCKDGHSPLVLSYSLSCVKCPDGHKNWWKFILVAFVPLTFFYFFVVLFNINVTSSRLHGVVWFSQGLSMPAFARLIMSSLRHDSHSLIAAKVFLVFYSFWNLDLFRSVLPDICLNITTLQALALDYLLALYPYILTLITYYLIELYDRKVVCIVIVWKPFHKILSFFRKSWDVRTSVIDSFATFFLLSYIKILSVSTDLLVPTQIYQLGSNRSTFGLYYTSSVAYFGREHLPYAILAIFILTLFVSVPTVTLILYPFRFFQKFLSLFPFNWHFLHAFVDSFQGCYKDGTQPGTFDCRWLSSVMLLIRPIFFITYGITLSMMYFIYTTIILVIFLIVLINIQPFKKKVASRYPSTDIVFFVLLSLCYGILIGRGIANLKHHFYTSLVLSVALLSAFAPILYVTFLTLFWFISRLKSLFLNINKLL